MTPRPERLPWEYEDGPQAGRDVPITNLPRDEQEPGVPARPDDGRRRPADGDRSRAATSASHERTERRTVRAEDRQLSPETNRRLTEELRDVVGADEVTVPADHPRATRGEHPQQRGLAAAFEQQRLNLLRSTLIMLTFGAVIALITNDWWLLPLAAGVHALGTMAVTMTTIRMTTISEHPSPTVAAAMSEEGVQNPDEHFSRMVEEFRTEEEHGASEVVSPGFNARTTEASEDPAAAAAEQSSAMTPTAGPSRPGGERATPDTIIWVTWFWLLAASIAIPPAMGGGWLWLLTAVMLPLLLAWALTQWLIAKRPERAQIRSRGALVTIVLSTAVAVAVFCAIVAFAFQH